MSLSTDSTATHYGGCLISTAHLGPVLCPKSQSVHDTPAAAASPIKCVCPEDEHEHLTVPTGFMAKRIGLSA